MIRPAVVLAGGWADKDVNIVEAFHIVTYSLRSALRFERRLCLYRLAKA